MIDVVKGHVMEKYSQQMHRYGEFYTAGQKDGLSFIANKFYYGKHVPECGMDQKWHKFSRETRLNQQFDCRLAVKCSLRATNNAKAT